ncbi:hypothetical protein DH2020_020675 [Rehmannia glutinosa]|uniref:Uncharacterized protein n=1 Tax=Rehmannia glutinosa TaxID=99300 RepID=A0ABR0WJM6_REHGL
MENRLPKPISRSHSSCGFHEARASTKTFGFALTCVRDMNQFVLSATRLEVRDYLGEKKCWGWARALLDGKKGEGRKREVRVWALGSAARREEREKLFCEGRKRDQGLTAASAPSRESATEEISARLFGVPIGVKRRREGEGSSAEPEMDLQLQQPEGDIKSEPLDQDNNGDDQESSWLMRSNSRNRRIESPSGDFWSNDGTSKSNLCSSYSSETRRADRRPRESGSPGEPGDQKSRPETPRVRVSRRAQRPRRARRLEEPTGDPESPGLPESPETRRADRRPRESRSPEESGSPREPGDQKSQPESPRVRVSRRARRPEEPTREPESPGLPESPETSETRRADRRPRESGSQRVRVSGEPGDRRADREPESPGLLRARESGSRESPERRADQRARESGLRRAQRPRRGKSRPGDPESPGLRESPKTSETKSR